MPSSYYKKSYRRMKRYYNAWTKYNPGALALKAGISQYKYMKPIVPYLKRAVIAGNTELKYHDADVALFTVSNAWTTPASICAPEQGVNQDERIGKSIRVTSLQLKMRIVPGSASTSTELVRVCVFREKYANPDDTTGAPQTPNATNVFADQMDSLRNMAFASRYDVLYDRIIPISAITVDDSQKFVKRYFKMNHHMKFPQDATTAPERNGLWIMFRSTNTSTAAPQVAYNTRARYLDD